ncbi:uncharacterized protein BDZ99DRAFT_147094 [Mytilinidion resinicola]|uniref:Uncharacterized protein n=1 Tax=Mytilinidion resinicola TaxID=574789 RepID=A0A6A6Y979_9PEZI|nr:uncharacterized protein BDZ99DRAFT_147094 [Mytilinidion resinicola]KAF2804524.1 hypothetical protein BDZ99DRAFT_147094 [Mytilinidion resinicola]
MPEYDLQYYPYIQTSMDNASRPPTTQQSNRPPLPTLRSTHVQAQEAREEVARFDAVLQEILRQKEIAGEHAARQAITRIQHKEAAKKADPAKKVEAAKAETDQASVTRSRSYARAPLCSHQVRWISVPGRSRCEYHSYSKNAYINPFRFRCPEYKTVACGLCMKKLKRGDTL